MVQDLGKMGNTLAAEARAKTEKSGKSGNSSQPHTTQGKVGKLVSHTGPRENCEMSPKGIEPATRPVQSECVTNCTKRSVTSVLADKVKLTLAKKTATAPAHNDKQAPNSSISVQHNQF